MPDKRDDPLPLQEGTSGDFVPVPYPFPLKQTVKLFWFEVMVVELDPPTCSCFWDHQVNQADPWYEHRHSGTQILPFQSPAARTAVGFS